VKKKFVGFGEVLLRLSPEGVYKIAQADRLVPNYTGAEANMAIALSYMGMPAAMVTRLPDHDVGHAARRMMDKFRVDTSHIAWGGERLGLYYLERGASQRPSKVIYDRKYSSIAEATVDDFDWAHIFEDAGWFHFTGITVALSESVQEICIEACKIAKQYGVKVSCDLNYRKNLWSPEEAQKAMKPLMQYVDVLIGNEEDAEKMLDIVPAGTDVTAGELDVDGYRVLTRRLAEEYGFEMVAVTLRESESATVNHWSALLYHDGTHYLSKKYTMHVVDRVGGGDSFASGLIYASLNAYAPQEIIEYATAASCLKHSIELDFNLSTPEEVFTLMNGDGSGRVQR